VTNSEDYAAKQDVRNKELIKRYRKGDKSALSDLCKENKGFIYKIAYRYCGMYGSDLPEDDLVQEGFIGLMKAADMYDVKSDAKFLTYAWWHIFQRMTTANINQGFAIRIPAYMMNEIGRLMKADELFQQKHGEERIKAIANYLCISEERVKELWKVTELLHLARADKPMDSNDENLRFKDFFQYGADNSFDDMERQVENADLLQTLVKIMKERLTERERRIIYLRFGLEDGKQHTLNEVGNKYFNVSKDRISQIEAKALRKMRGRIKEYGLQNYLL
jgi:RNA polymerase primary sigma factor